LDGTQDCCRCPLRQHTEMLREHENSAATGNDAAAIIPPAA
jgi:hypothetical protein